EALAAELLAERERAVQRGSVDREWIQKTVRWMVEWVPDSDLTLIAAIGRIARLTPTAVSKQRADYKAARPARVMFRLLGPAYIRLVRRDSLFFRILAG